VWVAEHPELILVMLDFHVSHPLHEVAETNFLLTQRTAHAEVRVPVDDNDIEGRRRCDEGEHSFKELICGTVSISDWIRCGLERQEGLVPRQIEMPKQSMVVRYGSLT
jgi:hypothetical protein